MWIFSTLLLLSVYSPTAFASIISKERLALAASRQAAHISDPNPRSAPANATSTSPQGKPSPDQTIGDYFAGPLGTDIASAKRNLVRTPTLLESIWYDGTNHFNISISKCVTFDTIAGDWSLEDGTIKQNATLLDINQDLQAPNITQPDQEAQYGSRILANAQLVQANAQAYLQTAVCDYTNDPHDELRKLLFAADGYWIATMTKSILTGSVSAGVYAGFFATNATRPRAIVAAGIAGAGVSFSVSVIDRLQMNGRLSLTEASIVSVFMGWYNAALHAMSSAQIGSDSAISGSNPCFQEADVENAIGALSQVEALEYGYSGLDALSKLFTCVND